MNNPKSFASSPKEISSHNKKRVRKQLCTKCCRKKLPASQGVKRPPSQVKKFKSTKDRPPTPFYSYVDSYCNKTENCRVSPAYYPTSPIYPPSSPPYVPTSPSYSSILSTSLTDEDIILKHPFTFRDNDFFGSSDESDF